MSKNLKQKPVNCKESQPKFPAFSSSEVLGSMMASNALKFPCNAAGFPKFNSSIGQRILSFKTRAIDAENMQDANQVELGIMCEPCGGRGWLVCDFCKGQKTNVKAENKKVYRRCPSCRAVGYVLCSKCKVYKCVTFPDASDGVNLMM